jgi:4-hydroxybenzoate polyprenyltransferase
MNRSGKIHALLSTARVANIPSVVSNVWLGAVVGISIDDPGENFDIPDIPWTIGIQLMLAGIFLYVSGNFLNDWMDRSWDERNRPERALPRGLFQPSFYLIVSVILMIGGIGLAAGVNPPAGVMAMTISISIIIYTIWHKRGAWTVIPMGLCRGLLPLMGAVGMLRSPFDNGALTGALLFTAFLGFGIFCYIVGLSLSARRESKATTTECKSDPAIALFVIAALSMIVPLLSGGMTWLVFIAPVPYIAWFGLCRRYFRRPISKYVSSLLAGIPLVDWVFLFPASFWEFSMHTPQLPSHPLELVSLALPPTAFVLALLLQRLAPAT